MVRAGAARKRPDRPLRAAAFMLDQDHATFLGAEVPAASVHRTILWPAGAARGTRNLRLSFWPQFSPSLPNRCQIPLPETAVTE